MVLFGDALDYQPGDVNHDGGIDINDITLLINYVLTGITDCPAEADVNADDFIDINDVTLLITKVITGS